LRARIGKSPVKVTIASPAAAGEPLQERPGRFPAIGTVIGQHPSSGPEIVWWFWSREYLNAVVHVRERTVPQTCTQHRDLAGVEGFA
jgi:hypothetical protein